MILNVRDVYNICRYKLSLFCRLLIVTLLSLTIIATVFDYVAYAEQMTWQWNQGI